MSRSQQPFASSVLASLAVLCSVAPLSAQAEPGVIRPIAVNKAFAIKPGQHHIYADRLPGDAPGIFTCCLTTQAAQTTPQDVVIGRYDRAKGTFTPTKEADALNTSIIDYGLSLEPRLGRYAVLQRGTQGPSEYLFSARARAGLPFPTAVKISGVPAQTFCLSLGYVGGRLKLFYVPPPHTAAVMHDFDISNLKAPKLVGSPQVVARRTSSSGILALAFPVTGRDGDVEGLLIAEGPKPWNSSLVFQAGLDPARHGSVVVAGCGSQCGITYSAVAGGRLLFATSIPRKPPVIQDVEVAWLLGDVVAPGGNADITAAVSSEANSLTLLFGSASTKPKVKLPRPLHVGHFALDLSTTLVLGAIRHPDASQLGGMSFGVPNDVRLRGLDVALQGLSFDARGKPLAWTNTAHLSVR